MNKISIGEKIPEDFRRKLVNCIATAFDDDLPRYLAEYNPETTNGIPHQVGDWINTNIRNHLINGSVDSIPFSRCGWKGKIIIDTENKVTYSIMRTNRLHQIRREPREHPHYLQTIVSVLNGHFQADLKQMTMADMGAVGFDQGVIDRDYDAIFQGRIEPDEGYLHCVVAYETECNEVIDIRIYFLDGQLDVIETVYLNEYLKPDFAKLTNIVLPDSAYTEDNQPSSSSLLSLRTLEDDNQQTSPVTISRVRKHGSA